MEKLYKYVGTVSSFNYRRVSSGSLASVDLVLYDMNNDDKAPIRIEAIGGLADYINEIEGTDAEERYIESAWYYDRNLVLLRIVVPSIVPGEPAKIIAQHDACSFSAETFGPAGYIETSKPEPMSRDQLSAWNNFKADDNHRYTVR